MPYITKESLQAAKQMDLLTYLQLCNPQNLVHMSGDTYCTREHDSLKISNGKWHWFSRHIGGRSALDYLIKVKGFSLPMAVEQINGYSTSVPVVPKPSQPKPKTICLPEPNSSTAVVRRYLKSRGIHSQKITKEKSMTNEELNTQLYQKMFYEQEQFREWLLGQPPEEILNHCYTYTVRENILLALETNDLSDQQCHALLKSHTPLEDVFREFEHRESDYMENVFDAMCSRADEVIRREKHKEAAR